MAKKTKTAEAEPLPPFGEDSEAFRDGNDLMEAVDLFETLVDGERMTCENAPEESPQLKRLAKASDALTILREIVELEPK